MTLQVQVEAPGRDQRRRQLPDGWTRLGIYREAFHLLITLILLVTRQLFLKILEDNSFLGVVF